MYHSISKAKKSIYWESYIFLDDEIGKKFITLLMKKAKKGVEVILLFDALGSYWISKKSIQALTHAGVDVRLFSRKRTLSSLKELYRFLRERTHRKILVVDNTVGFIGGVNVKKSHADWLDVVVRISGAICRHLSRAIAKNYIFSGGDKKNVKHILHPHLTTLKSLEFIFQERKLTVRKAYIQALRQAKEHILFATPYYAPDPGFLLEISRAVKRGVKVDLIIPFRTDVKFVTYLARAFFSLTHLLGVRLHLLNKMMHGKAVVVDDKFAIVGSSNLDRSSFKYNYEASAKITQRVAVRKVKKILEQWKQRYGVRFDVKKWAQRGWWRRVKEWFVKHFSGEL